MNVMFSSLLTGGSFSLFLFINVIISIASSSANEEYYETRHRQLPRRREAYETEVPANDRYRYRENAETEFKRPGYFPVPFVVGGITSATSRHNNNANGGGGGYGDLRTMPIPSVDLSALIRQHIAHQRQKLLGSQEGQLERYTPPPTLGPLLEGVSRITELRQTPYRRFSDDLSAVATTTYAEKRRRWKAELKRRLRGPKVPARPIGDGAFSSSGNSPEESMVIRDGAADRRRVGSGTHRVGGGTDHYYVTYSPQARIYQVSRRPPPNLYATDDQTPTSIGTPSPPAEEVLETGVHRGPVELQPPTASTSTTTTSTTTTTELPPFVQLEDDDTDMEVAWPSAPPTARTYLVRPPPEVTTTTAAPAIIVVQRAEPVAAPNYTQTEQIWVAPDAELTRIRFPVIKQILHLDDYYQELNDDDMEDVMDEDVMEGQNEKSGDIATMPIMSNGDPPTTFSTTKTITTTITPTLNHIQSRVVLNEQSDEEEEDGNNESRWDQQQKQQEQRQQSAVDSRQPPIVYPGNDATPRNQYVVPTAPLPPAITTITPTSPRSREVEVVINTDDGDKEEEEEEDDDLFFWKSERPSSRFTRRSNNTRPLASSAAWAASRLRDDPFQIVIHEDDA